MTAREPDRTQAGMKNLAIRSVPGRQAGVGMIEILVTVFILAIGLLGIAGVQFMSKRANFEATQRTTATLLANDILERMRANTTVLFDYVSEGTPLGLGGGTIGTEPSASSTVPSDIALRDLWEWEQAIDGATELTGDTTTGGLVSPTACVFTAVPVGSGSQTGRYMVTIVWRGTAKLSDPVNPASPVPSPDPYSCGRATTKYHSDGATDNAHRRILVVNTFIAQ